MQRLIALITTMGIATASCCAMAQVPENFRRENVVAWCIVPFDAKQRSPTARTKMLQDLGIKKCAYDWRASHIPQFEEEIERYKNGGIDFFAFWDRHDDAFELFRKHDIHPQIWKTLDTNPGGSTQSKKVLSAIESMLPLAEEAKKLGCKLGLYNHGGWGGEPDNLVAVCSGLHELGHQHVGIVYNLHHGHGHIEDFDSSLEKMKPYLMCLNLNGMVDLAKPANAHKKILPIGTGVYERQMIASIVKTKYSGPIGVLGHVAERDVAEVLKENIEGLEWILGIREKPEWLEVQEESPQTNEPLVKLKSGGQALDARLGFLNIQSDPRLDRPGFSVHCRAKLFSKDDFNILVAKNPKSSSTHWELYTYAKTGAVSFFMPGYDPSEIKSSADVVDGKWHDIQVDFLDAERVVLRVDDEVVLDRRVKRSDRNKVIEGPLTIGSLASQQIGCDGYIDSVRIQSRTGSKQTDGLILGDWAFDDITATTQIKDRSSIALKTDFVQTSLGAEYLSKWTPKSRQSTRFPYENEKDPDWVDHRYSKMDTGPFMNQSIKVPGRGVIPKAIAVKARTDRHAHFIFNSETLNVESAWTGEFVALPPARFGILQTPSVAGAVKFLGPGKSKWILRKGNEQGFKTVDESTSEFKSTLLLSNKVAMYYEIGDTTVFEIASVDLLPSFSIVERKFGRTLTTDQIGVPLFDLPANLEMSEHASDNNGKKDIFVWRDEKTAFVLRTFHPFDINQGRVVFYPKMIKNMNAATAWYGRVPIGQVDAAIAFLSKKEPNLAQDETPNHMNLKRRWGDPIQTTGQLSNEKSAFVVDTIAIPFKNRFNALMFTSGFDFLPDGRAFVCTVHGDVWLVSGIDDKLDNVTWQRFATGLYQPLGLKVIGRDPIVMCRDRLTKLSDINNDGEADAYENFNDDLVITGQNHGYAMSLETDPQGNFYFIKSGSTPPHGGTMLRVSKDGTSLDVFSTGYRHANGLGVSPTGLVTSADNEGNWVPATRIDVVEKGGFYGHIPTHRRKERPEIYDSPMMWMPRSMDNSAGGQVWVESGKWDELNGAMIHFSFGRCTANIVLPQHVKDSYQAAAYKMDLPPFLSGSMRGRFRKSDGHLYVCGLDGWQTAAVQDGCFQRVRRTHVAHCMPVRFEVDADKIHIQFSSPIDTDTATKIENWNVEQWNYRWSEAYGSDHYSIQDPNKIGHDTVEISTVSVSEDAKSVVLEFEQLKPVMQMNIKAKIKDSLGRSLDIDLINTINTTKVDGD